jgi:Cu+-exporting ATPase
MTTQHANTTLFIEGMDCSNCAAGITKSLQKKGMQNVHVNFATGEASFHLPDTKLLKPAIAGIEELGYKVVDSQYLADQEGKMSRIEKRFYFTLPFTIILFFSHMLFPHDFILNNQWIQLLLCLPVFVVGVLQFGKSAWGSVKSGVPNMDVLIFIGSASAFIYSLAGMYLYENTHQVHNYLFFETSATIITLVLLGNVFEHRSVKQTTTAIHELGTLQTATAKLLSLHLGKEVISEVPVKSIVPGSILQVNTGDSIPVDGEIYSGEATIDESMLSGESIPLDKSPGAKVFAGTILVTGNIRMRAESVGGDTVLSKIIDLVKKAQREKPDIQRLGDKISAIFVPVVLLIAVATFLITWLALHKPLQDAVMNSIAVLVISCPCAMGLATPTAVMTGIGRAAKKGIIIKGGQTLEIFAAIKTIVLDKTGTLTTGDFRIKNIKLFGTSPENEIKEILYNLEQHSSHPIARSILKELKGTAYREFVNIAEEKGRGISAEDKSGNKYEVGSLRILKDKNAQGSHDIYVLKNDQLIAAIDLEDQLKANAAETLHALRSQGIETVLLSGDRKNKSEHIAKMLGINKVYSEKNPEEKLQLIAQMNSAAATAMVGDGVNDAPALAKASLGISMGNSTQAAIESAQVVLLGNNDLSALAEAHLISKHTLITIKQNLFWAFAYNIVAIPIAAAGMLNPMAGALFMAFSDIIVIGNSIRLKTKKLK